MAIKWDMAGVVIGLIGTAFAIGMWVSNRENSTGELAKRIKTLEATTGSYALKGDLPDTTQFVLQSALPDTSQFALKTALPNSSQFALKSELTALSESNPPQSIPKDLVAFFNSAECPSGWAAEDLARGRYIVGVNAPGQIGAIVGEALKNKENRATGQHTHPFVDRYNLHGAKDGYLDGGGKSGSSPFNKTTSGVTGAIADTNAPYLQLLPCKKR